MENNTQKIQEIFFQNSGLEKFVSEVEYSLQHKKDLIVNILDENLPSNIIDKFIEYTELFNSRRLSFIVVSSCLSYDSIPEEISLAPTVQEAIDIIEMENIQRDLGF